MPDVPDGTAVRVALWRALHLHVDPPPHVLENDVGRLLADPGDDRLSAPAMNPAARAGVRASMVARARYVENLALEQARLGTNQYVILGAGLDSFVLRRPEAGLTVYEIDRPERQAWKRRRPGQLGYGIPDRLRFVPVDFETARPAVLAATGLAMYLTRDPAMALLREAASLARVRSLP